MPEKQTFFRGSRNTLQPMHLLPNRQHDNVQFEYKLDRSRPPVKGLETIYLSMTTVEGLKLAAQTFDQDVAKLSFCSG